MMKIAGGIIGILLGLLVFLQSCTVATTAHLVSDGAATQAGSVGIFVGLLFLIGGAFSFGLPLIATIIFAMAALLAFAVSGDFSDMMIWGIVSAALAAMAFFAWRSGRPKRAAAAATTVQDR
jgi:hypothetical protein